MPYKVARETYLQSFHFKIVNRYLACRSNLYKWKKAESPICSYCNEIDTIEHHLYYCNTLQHFWDGLFSWLTSIYSIRIDLSMFDIIFGIPNENDDYMFNLFNYIILLAKNFVYNCKINY